MALLRKGCCCCQLRTCVLAQAWLGLIIAVVEVVGGLLLFAIVFGLIPSEDLPDFLAPHQRAGAGRQADLWRYQKGIGAAILVVTGSITLAVAVAMIYGCKKENRRLLLPSLISGAIALLFFTILSVIMIIILDPMIAAVNAVANVIFIGLGVYMWFHILSYYMELREEDKELKRQSL